MGRNFDVIVIGTGSAASSAAFQCRSAGQEVAIIDSRPFGGTCALRGCDPKKVLVGASDLVDWSRRLNGRGVVGDLRIDWPSLMRFKRTFTEPVPARRERAFAESGIVAIRARAHFVAPASVQAGDDVLTAKHIVIATGAKPARLKIPGEDLLTTSETFLDLESLTERIIFAGGGYIAFEFAHIAARAGSSVTILHRGPRPLERFDPDLVEMLTERTRQIKAEVQLGTAVEAVEQKNGKFIVHARHAEQLHRFEADMVVHAAGRVADVDDLQLSAAGVEFDRRGVSVNDFLQSVSNPSVYAAGDAAAGRGAPLTPVAGYEGRVAATNLLHGNHEKPDYRGLASVVFTTPPLAACGFTEDDARRANLRFRTRFERTAGWYSSQRIAENCSGYKVLIEEGTDRILGAHLIGDRAEELINLFALAIRANIRSGDLKSVLYGYPTHGSDIQYML